jgi:large subunit ribosomal protein L3
MKFILGEKQHMTQVFDEKGRVHPVTVIKAGPVVVTQIKTLEADGYDAVQVGFGTQKESRLGKAILGHMKKANGAFKVLKETRVTGDESNVAIGDTFDVSIFAAGDSVTATSISKGKGFQGVVKRHGFAGGPRTHGQKHNERSPGSIGAGGVQLVRKGKRMGGRMGSDQVTLAKVKIVHVDQATGELYVRGAIPGRRGTLVEIRG